MAKSKNVKLGVEPEGQIIDLSDVDTSPSAGTAMSALRAQAEPRTPATRTPARRTTDATAVAQSLDTPALGDAYEKTTARLARSSNAARVGSERPLTNAITGQVVEGMAPALVERVDEEPTNVPRNRDKDGLFRNQIHGDYSHFAKVTNLLGFLGDKAGAAQDALGADHPAAAQFDEIHKILSVAHGHLMDARNAHTRGETGLVRRNPQTGLASPIGRQFTKEGREDPFGGQAMERAVGGNPIAKINQAIGEPQLRSEGVTTQALDSTPYGAVPHFHRAIQHIVTAANLLQGSLADVSSDQRLGSSVKAWDGKYDERPGDPDTVNHALKINDEYANSVAKGGSEIVKENDDMAEMAPTAVSEMFDRTKKAHQAELQAKVQQAEIHAGLVAKNYRELFGSDVAARREEAARQTAERQTLPVIPAPASLGRGVFSGSRKSGKAPLESIIEKTQNANDQDYAKEVANVSLENSKVAIRNSLPALQKAASDAVASGKIDSATLDTINGIGKEAWEHHTAAITKSSQPIETPEAPTLTYDASRDPRFIPENPIAYERMSPSEKVAERNKFLASRGQSLTAWQKESKAFEEKLPVIRAQDANALAEHKAATARAIVDHHSTVAGHAKNSIDAVSRIHKILTAAGVVTSTAEPVSPDMTGIPTPEQYSRVSRQRPATRAEALDFMASENAKAAAESEAKAKAEAERKAALEASRPDRNSAVERAKEFGFLTLDEDAAQAFLDAGKGAKRGSGAVGKRRAAFLGDLAVKGAVDFSATPKKLEPGKALFIAPDAGIPETPANPINPRTARRRQAAAARLNTAAAESGRRRLAGQVGSLGLNLEDVTAPEPKTTRATRGVSASQQEAEENKAIVEGLKRNDAAADSKTAAARTSLQNIQEMNSTSVQNIRQNLAANAATTVGTTIKPTRRTR